MSCKYYCLGREEVGYEKLFANLKRINTVLDGEQQREFNGWVYRLAKAKKTIRNTVYAFYTKERNWLVI
ncbi:hypothetical protein [Aliivibrio fischeri]|uniref:Uncharacterized protein n=1 Tax=Aliivibrio fischeri TaxID=668 RepID=A0A510UEW5_ALIFS|nr:hypothetical protein [Aliivibrio fischeri]GEK13086.1 hypothetical protein AFI02nite_11220 [Aliivibrio fischeri]